MLQLPLVLVLIANTYRGMARLSWMRKWYSEWVSSFLMAHQHSEWYMWKPYAHHYRDWCNCWWLPKINRKLENLILHLCLVEIEVGESTLWSSTSPRGHFPRTMVMLRISGHIAEVTQHCSCLTQCQLVSDQPLSLNNHHRLHVTHRFY